MLATERRELICKIVNEKKRVRVSELSRRLHTTEATVRRDLSELQNEKKVLRTHGGAVSVSFKADKKKEQRQDEKRRAYRAMAEAVYSFLREGDTLLLDGSESVLELCGLLKTGKKRGITVVTNSFQVVESLKDGDLVLIHVGGNVNSSSCISVGTIAENVIRSLRVNKAIFSVQGVEPRYGCSVLDFAEASMKHVMMESAEQVFVLAEHSSFSSEYLAKVTDSLEGVDYLITDSHTPKLDYTPYSKKVKLVTAL